MTGLTIEELPVGTVAEVTHNVTVRSIAQFVAASGDDNPIHSDAAFAAASRFGRVIAPGMLTGSFVSGVIGTRLPGPGTIYLSQSLKFLKPVFVGDRVTARVEVAERIVERNRVRLLTSCVNQDGERLLEGEAWVLPSRERIEYGITPVPRRAPVQLSPVLAFSPAALGVQWMSMWAAGCVTLTEQTLRLALEWPRPTALAAAEPDPVRP